MTAIIAGAPVHSIRARCAAPSHYAAAFAPGDRCASLAAFHSQRRKDAMSDQRTDQLPAAAALEGDELVAIVQDGNSRRATANDLVNTPHGHEIDHVAGLQDALDALADAPSGASLPEGGATGQVLKKISEVNGAADWFNGGSNDFYVSDFEAEVDTGTDQSSHIQAAIDAAGANGGGNVFLEFGDYDIASTLGMKPGVDLIGVRSRAPSNAAPADGSRLLWTGPGTAGTSMVLFATDTVGAPSINYEGGLRHLSLDGGGLVQNALRVNSWVGGKVEGLDIRNVNTALANSRGILLGTQAAGALADPSDTQDWVFEQFYIRVSGVAVGMAFTGVVGANTSFNTFRRGRIIHDDGHGLFVYHGDNNRIDDLRVWREAGGIGRSVAIGGNTASGANINDANIFRGCYFQAPMAIHGTESGYDLGKAVGNKFIDLDASNGSATPVSAGVLKESGGSPIIWRTTAQANFTSTA